MVSTYNLTFIRALTAQWDHYQSRAYRMLGDRVASRQDIAGPVIMVRSNQSNNAQGFPKTHLIGKQPTAP